MTRRKRRNHSAEFKVKVALAAIKGDHTLAELSTQFDLHQNQIIDWKNQLLEQSVNIFSRPTAQQEPEIDLKALHAKIGHQALQIDFLEGALRKIGQLSGKKSICNRSEEHTSELQSRENLVCRLLLEKKKNKVMQYA